MTNRWFTTDVFQEQVWIVHVPEALTVMYDLCGAAVLTRIGIERSIKGEMNRNDIDDMLSKTLDDLRLTRTEKRAFTEVLADLALDGDDIAYIQSRAFDIARRELDSHRDRLAIDWLEKVVKVVQRQQKPPSVEHIAQAWFSDRDDCASHIVELIGEAQQHLEVCVFTITDDRISRALEGAHRRGVRLRIVTDDDKASDRGSDVDRLSATGIAVRVDRTESHMHHKYALFDKRLLLTGSYNWTRGAADDNDENFVVLGDPRLVGAYTRAFEELWVRVEN